MANPFRGEIEAELNGRRLTLCLTLAALAELEAAFGAQDLQALAERFETGRLKASDITKILAAGLRGAGHAFADDDVAQMRCEKGVPGLIDIVAILLKATFSSD